MLELIFAFLLGLACPGHTTTTTHSTNDNITVSAQSEMDDTGGEGAHIPPGRP
ncbi:hypothetical protein [Pedobacter lusitanus]|uniref:hypothetical protein n=1 Tax=Pedobacter lusitanus TaxID=1503925 RepID=UPI000A80BBD6|nr:hypothetical protein [Pedobacter lusitanus]